MFPHFSSSINYSVTTWASWYLITVTAHELHHISNHQAVKCLFNSFFGATSKEHQSSVLLTLCEGNPPGQGPVTWKMAPLLDIIVSIKWPLDCLLMSLSQSRTMLMPKQCITSPLWWEFTSDKWIPQTNRGPVMWKVLPCHEVLNNTATAITKYDYLASLWGVFTNSCLSINGSLAKLPLKLGTGWVITPHRKLWS